MKDISQLYPGKNLIPVESIVDTPPIAVAISADVVDPINDTPILNVGTEGGEITEALVADNAAVEGTDLTITNQELASSARVGDTVEILIDGVATNRIVKDINTVDGIVIFESTDPAADLAAITAAATLSLSVVAETSVFTGDVIGDVTGDVTGDLVGTATNSEHILITDNDSVVTGQKEVLYMHIDDYEDAAFVPVNTTLYLLHDS